jgi:hypothetical protein
VIVDQPEQKVARLLDLAGVERRRALLQLRRQLLGLGHHRLPVAHRLAHLLEHVAQPRRQRLEPGLRAQLAADLEVHPGLDVAVAARQQALQPAVAVALDAEQRVQRHLRLPPLLLQLAADGGEEERHVVVDEIDRRVRRAPAVAFQRRL